MVSPSLRTLKPSGIRSTRRVPAACMEECSSADTTASPAVAQVGHLRATVQLSRFTIPPIYGSPRRKYHRRACDKLEDVGVQKVREVASNTNDIADDGTTTAIVAAQ